MNLKVWERRGKSTLTRSLNRVLRARGEAGEVPDFRDLERVLIVRQQNQLGDMLLATPILRAIRKRNPELTLDLVCGVQNEAAVRNNARVNDVLLYDKITYWRRPAEAKRFVERLRDARYDLALVSSTVSFSITSAWIAAISGARWRAGRPGPQGKGKEVAEDLFHWLFAAPDEKRHQSEQNLEVVEPFGAKERDLAPEIFLSEEESRSGGEDLRDALGERGGSLRILIHPGAGKEGNRWPAAGFGRVAARLLELGHRVAICSGPGERHLLDRLEKAAQAKLPRLPLVEVRRLAGAIAESDLLLANDTGVLHLGAALGVPVLALFGPTDPAIWCPAHPSVRYLRSPSGDLGELSSDRVTAAACGFASYLAGLGEAPIDLTPAPGANP